MLGKIKLVAPIKLHEKRLKLIEKLAIRCELPKKDYLKRHIKHAR
jgi:hypothetical protein